MATKDSEELKSDERYPLGDYSFRIERTSVPGSSNDKIEAICTDKDGKNARKSIQVPSSSKIEGWYVEANETTADVYVVLEKPKEGSGSKKRSDLDTSPVIQPITCGNSVTEVHKSASFISEIYIYDTGNIMCIYNSANMFCAVVASPVAGEFTHRDIWSNRNTGQIISDVTHTQVLNYYYSHDDKPVYYYYFTQPISGYPEYEADMPSTDGLIQSHKERIAWTIVHGTAVDPEYEEVEILLGRFAIEIEEAGGVGPGGGIGGGWTDPEDYDEDWEEGDPTHTLYVEVTGALSGRHNDPIEDPSYSYIPADKDTVKDYGCGGDGGHGGGGGAGASTVVVHKFATNQANSKEVTAIARRHGYGSGGGKGGKGGDGCILVYY